MYMKGFDGHFFVMAIKEYKLMGIKTSQSENWWTIISFNGH